MGKISQVMPYIDSDEMKYLEESITEKWLTEGPKSKEFIEHIKEFTGSKYAVFAPNGTLGLFLGLLALDLPKDSEIIIPSFTFFASASSAVFAGLQPVFVDVDEDTFNIDVDEVEKLITSKTKAIMPVHIYGSSVNMDAIIKIAEKYKLRIIEDAAQAYGVKFKNKHCGTFGDIGVISFFADKTITMGEGAVVLTQDELIYKKLLLLRNQGRPNSGSFIHPSLGMNFRVTDLQCGVGLSQAKKFPEILEKKIKKYNLYKEKLSGIGDLEFVVVGENSNFVPFRFVLKTDHKKNLTSFLEENDIETRSCFYPMHLQPPLKKYVGKVQGIKVSEKIYNTGICLPLHHYLTENDIEFVTSRIISFFDNFGSLS